MHDCSTLMKVHLHLRLQTADGQVLLSLTVIIKTRDESKQDSVLNYNKEDIHTPLLPNAGDGKYTV